MVSDDNLNDESTAPKKRTRLFGGRAPKRATDHASQSEPGFDAAHLAEPEPAAQSALESAHAVEPETAPASEAAPAKTRRKPAATAATAAQAEPDAPTEPAKKRERGAKREPDASAPSDANAASDASASLDESPAFDASTSAVEKPVSAPVFPELKPESTTSLLFFAPPVAAVSPSRRPSDADALDDDEGTSTSRRRSRTRRSRGGASADGDARNEGGRSDASRGDAGRGDSGRGDDSGRSRGRRSPEPITEPQRIKGSTRLEAKKQRRRDGRDAGRRRPVVTEAEFLARRESVDRAMVVRSKDGRIQIGVLEDGVLVEHYVARSSESSLIGNVYLGKVQNVLPSMEAAFVDIGRGRNAVLYSGEVDWDSAALDSDGKTQPRRIELALKPGDKVLVQVTKDPIGHKGARLTSQVSLPGRYLVYVPNGSMSGISRKLPDTERARLKKILKEVLPENVGVIVRTAAEGATEEQLTLDVQRLTSQWADISTQLEKTPAPALLHSEPDLLIKIIRDVFNEDFSSLVISGADAQQTIESYLRGVAPDLLDRVKKYEGDHDPFDEYRISEQIEKALDRKVWLPSGGSLVIDRTEAMTVVDVNTGKFVGSGGNLEETVTKNNLEAAEELVRQLRLRDIGGIIVVDFIDMVLESNRDLVLRRLIECLSRDRTKHQVAEVTSLGLVQMTRKRLGLGLLETFSETCDVCAGRGLIIHHDPVAKHRAPSDSTQNGGGRRRGGGNSPNGGGARNGGSTTKSGPSAGTHAITDDVSRALAQIAAKTVASTATGAITLPSATDAAAEQAVASTDSSARVESSSVESASVESSSGQRGSTERGATEPGTTEPGTTDSAGTEPSATTLEILDIPVEAKPVRKRAALDPKSADELLDSVLESLPEPPAPGTRKRASRRVTSGTITTTSSADGS
ncbi:MAG: Rne/Rng family ribonuclease [Microcella sp.]|uniref:Rne/Rng family ribonuclease n=1 Tax=Microcella sp. TaxID=1913979 RepID=UPI0024CD1283|nr:Rne/Rng family ribonuclease [Microcella sp.]UYN84611.1 MAG: Rne/Rng family ribonuclease [Microcella sp.]